MRFFVGGEYGWTWTLMAFLGSFFLTTCGYTISGNFYHFWLLPWGGRAVRVCVIIGLPGEKNFSLFFERCSSELLTDLSPSRDFSSLSISCFLPPHGDFRKHLSKSLPRGWTLISTTSPEFPGDYGVFHQMAVIRGEPVRSRLTAGVESVILQTKNLPGTSSIIFPGASFIISSLLQCHSPPDLGKKLM